MLNKSEKRKLAAKIKRWDKVSDGINSDWTRYWDGTRKDIKKFMDSLMFNKKPKNRIDLSEKRMMWWVKIAVIFFAFKGVTYWLKDLIGR
jgi:hypothetical protein